MKKMQCTTLIIRVIFIIGETAKALSHLNYVPKVENASNQSAHYSCVNQRTTVRTPVKLTKYKNFKDTTYFHDYVPINAVKAVWTFSINSAESCALSNITVLIRLGSFPIVDNIVVPKDTEIEYSHQQQFELPGKVEGHAIEISPLIPGVWYAAALHNATKDSSIAHFGEKACYKQLQTNFTLFLSEPLKEVTLNYPQRMSLMENITTFRVFPTVRTLGVKFSLLTCVSSSKGSECPIVVHLQPTLTSDEQTSIDCSNIPVGKCNLKKLHIATDRPVYIRVITPQPNLTFGFLVSSLDAGCVLAQYPSSPNVDLHELSRTSEFMDLPASFNLIPTYLDDFVNVVSLASDKVVLLAWKVDQANDVGGSLLMSLYGETNSTNAYSVTACLRSHVIPLKNSDLSCLGDNLHQAISLNSSSAVSLGVPYPSAGWWYLAMQAQCFNDTEIVPCITPEPIIRFKLNIVSCLQHSCSGHGDCRVFYIGIMIFAHCDCDTGWTGLTCSRSTLTEDGLLQLVFTLLLTLSNLCFIPAIVLCLRRKFYVEALVYFCNMLFSTFYHACDVESWSSIALCIMPYNVLSFSDFYCSIMSFWVTFVMIANPPKTVRSLAHMLGAVVLAMAVRWRQHSFIIYIVPVIFGSIMVLISWIIKCCHLRAECMTCRQVLWLLPGLFLAVCGIAIYGFFETNSNYPYLHSIWHMCMSCCILFFIPSAKKQSRDNFEEEVDDSLLSMSATSDDRFDAHDLHDDTDLIL